MQPANHAQQRRKIMSKQNDLCLKIMEFFQNDPAQIQHFTLVHSFARLIGEEEELNKQSLELLEAAAFICTVENAADAEKILSETGYEKDTAGHILQLANHQQTWDNADRTICQILSEAKFLAACFENPSDTKTTESSIRNNIRTDTGSWIAHRVLLPKPEKLSETWAQDGLQELEDFIESQGIYIRQ